MAYITPRYQRARAIYTERMSFDSFLELPEEHREALVGVWMGNAIRDEQFRYSQRLANQKWVGGVWEHALIERDVLHERDGSDGLVRWSASVLQRRD